MNDPSARLSADSDMALILALAYILYTQNADRALIIALLSIIVM